MGAPAPTGATAGARRYAVSGAASDAVTFQFSRDGSENNSIDSNEQFGFRLRGGVIELQLGAGNWQALTDATLLAVTTFSITPTVEEIDLGALCSKPCPAGSSTCPPRQQVRWRESLLALAGLGATTFVEIGPGKHFFGSQHTLRHYETAFFEPPLSDNTSFEQWRDAGSSSSEERASALVRRTLANYEAPPIDDAVDEELRDFVARRKAAMPDQWY